MAKTIEIGFSKNMYDKDGDIMDDCILLYFNDTFILRVADLDDLDSVITQLQFIRNEIATN